MKNMMITMGTGLICLLMGPICTWPQRIALLIVAAGGMWCLVEGMNEMIEKAREIRNPGYMEDLRRRNSFRQLLLTATLPERISTLQRPAEKRSA